MSLRIRSIHGGQWKDEAFISCSPLARLLAIGLRNLADDNGVFEWKPKTIKLELLGADDCDIVALLGELEQTEQIKQFAVGSKTYGYIRNFGRYQRPKQKKILYPAPPSAEQDSENFHAQEEKFQTQSENFQILVADGGGRREDEGCIKTEAIASAKAATVDDEIRKFVADNRLIADPVAELAKFVDWKLAKGKRFRNDRAAFRNWLRKADEIARDRGATEPVTVEIAAERSAEQEREIYARRVSRFRAFGKWDDSWGPRPDLDGRAA